MKKGPGRVSSIKGGFEPDLISQTELRQASEAQAMEWRAARIAHRMIENLERRLQEGATVEPGSLFFDAGLKMVRSKKDKAVGE